MVLICSIICIQKQEIASQIFFNGIAIVFRQERSYKRIIILSLPSLVILSSYENYLTSELTVVEKVKPMENVKEVINEGYMIYDKGGKNFRDLQMELLSVLFYVSNKTEEANKLSKDHVRLMGKWDLSHIPKETPKSAMGANNHFMLHYLKTQMTKNRLSS